MGGPRERKRETEGKASDIESWSRTKTGQKRGRNKRKGESLMSKEGGRIWKKGEGGGERRN